MVSPLSKSLPVTTAIVVANAGVDGRLHDLFDCLAEARIVATVVREPDEATAQVVISNIDEVQCVLVEAGDLTSPEGCRELVKNVRLIAAVPDIEPIVLGHDPPADLIIQCIRAGGGDVVNLDTTDPRDIVPILQRVADRSQERALLRRHIRGLRTALEDFLKNLVKTERRYIDLERQLAAREQRVDQIGELDPDRPPAVLIVEDDPDVVNLLVDELERANLTTFAFMSGEEAVVNAVQMSTHGQAIDLALVDARLPGMDGLEAIRRMREAKPDLAAILMTGFSDTETAISAADLGVVGYVLKPFDDIRALIARVRDQASHNMISARERHYLTEIKQRHEKILLRYRKLAAELEID